MIIYIISVRFWCCSQLEDAPFETPHETFLNKTKNPFFIYNEKWTKRSLKFQQQCFSLLGNERKS